MHRAGQRSFVRAAKVVLPAAVLALSVVGAMTPSSAQAQFFNWGGGDGWGGGGGWEDRGEWGGMGPGEIHRSIGERGFRVIAPMRRNGAVFVAEVIDRLGRRERLIVSAANAQILQRFVFTDQPRARNAGLMPSDDVEQQMDRADPGDVTPPVPPGLIPNVGRGRAHGDAYDRPAIEPIRPRPPQRAARPVRPKLVDRTPDAVQPDREPATTHPLRVKSRPSEPLRLPSAPAPTVERQAEPSTLTASRPAELPTKPSAPVVASEPQAPAAVSAVPSSRMRDPLAIPRSEPKRVEPQAESASTAEPRRVVPGTVTGAPAPVAVPKPAAAAPAKAGDVPVAPLD